MGINGISAAALRESGRKRKKLRGIWITDQQCLDSQERAVGF